MRTVEEIRMKMSTSGFLEPAVEGTKVTYIKEYEMPYSVLGKFVDKVKYSRDVEKFMDAMLVNLKNTPET